MNYLYHNICLRITIADKIQFAKCSSIRIEQSVEVLSNTAKIELPREFRNAIDEVGKTVNISGKSILNFMNRGDKIKIEFGYDNDLQTEFEGYINRIGAETPLVLECEDEMYQLKRAPRVTKFIKSGKLKDILKAVLPTYYIECNSDYNIGKWMIEDMTPYQVLEELREKAGIRAYFKTPYWLVVGMVVDFKSSHKHYYNFSRNVRRGSDLKFMQTEKPYHLTVESTQANGSVLTLSKGEKGGNETTIKLWPNLSKSELQKWIDAKFEVATSDGFQGSLNGWCYPRTNAGEAVYLERPYYPDKHQDGVYFIESVTIDVNGSDGIIRQNTIGYKLS